MIEVVGTGMGGKMPSEALEIVARAEVLAGGAALLGRFAAPGQQTVALASPMSEALDALAEHARAGRSVVVLADGDPLFFGVGGLVVRRFGLEAVRVHANVCALQTAAARLGLPWSEAKAVSLHGRTDPSPLFAALTHHQWVGVYTDPDNTPARIADLLATRGVRGAAMHVFPRLGMEDESHAAPSLDQARGMDFPEPNFVLLANENRPDPRLGRPDGFFAHQAGLITKAPVRAAALAALDLPGDAVLWDLGAGCGAVGIEAAALLPRGRVLAVEQDPERISLIRANLAKARAWLVEPVAGTMPEALADLPDPDRIFLGGGTRDPKVLDACAGRLAPGGVLVAHAILLGTLHAAMERFTALGWPWEVVQLGAAAGEPLAGDLRLAALNPVFAIRAVKPGEAT